MAKYKYKNYDSKKKSSSNTRYLILALSIIIIGTVLLIKSRTPNPAAGGVGSDNSNDPGTNVLNVSGDQGDNQVDRSDDASAGDNSLISPNHNGSQRTNRVDVKMPQTPPKTTEINKETLSMITDALQEVDKGNVIAARDTLNTVLSMPMPAEYRTSVKARLNNLAKTWLFGKEVLPGDTMTEYYRVHPGEVISTIGRKFNVPHEIIMQINGIKDPRRLQAGQTIKVIKGPFHIKIDRSQFVMDLYLGNKLFVKSYGVGLGAKDQETPVGKWRVERGGKLIEPDWTHPDTKKIIRAGDSEYPLGSRWIGIEGLDDNTKHRTGFALHGTKDPKSIGNRSSRGCIRLFNGDAIEVYNLLVPVQSEVLIVD